jgi:type IV secretion system protein VirB10
MQVGAANTEATPVPKTLAELKFEAVLMDDGNKNAPPASSENEPQNGASPYASDSAGGGKLSDLMKPTTTGGKSAGVLGDRNLTLAKGNFIECFLETRIDTSVPGMTSCVLPRDIYSDNGKVLLLERGSKVTGEYQSGLEQGAKRVFVLWNRVKTPNGVTVNLDSPSTDALGGAGMSGKVNNHWGTRFGNALLFSIIEDGFSYLANRGSTASSGGVVYQNSQDSATKITEEFLKQGANIAPNLVKNQGERIGIYVSRDLYFGSVYELKAK